MMGFIEQCKGKDLNKVPSTQLLNGKAYYCAPKYDGNYVQIHKIDGKVKFFTSGGKEFYLSGIAEDILSLNQGYDFIIETEYIGNTDGRLGSRGECTTTTFRVNHTKGIKHNGKNCNFKIFDIIYFHDLSKNKPEPDLVYEERIMFIINNLRFPISLSLVEISAPMTIGGCIEAAKALSRDGYEGVMAYQANHKYKPGKRQNTSIKIKNRPTADLKCISVEEGDGKYTGLIGSLVLEDDEKRIVKVGSGLNDADRQATHTHFIGKIIEIEYEQILDTYIQPVYKCIRKDKSE